MTEPLVSSYTFDLCVMGMVLGSLIALAVCAGWEKRK
jgi:hypothetical protein